MTAKAPQDETHPKVPPNCPYFVADGLSTFFRYDHGKPQSGSNSSCGSTAQYVDLKAPDNPERLGRPIIAAVASMAWRAEGARLRQAWLQPQNKMTGDSWKAHLKAYDHAAAWERWAEGGGE